MISSQRSRLDEGMVRLDGIPVPELRTPEVKRDEQDARLVAFPDCHTLYQLQVQQGAMLGGLLSSGGGAH
jgi:hypothetical protein